MNPHTTYKKTAKGLEEMATRAYRLAARERSILVLVDGKSTGAELIAKGRSFGDSEAFVNRLLEAGFIEPAGDGSASSASGRPAPPDRMPPLPGSAAAAAPSTASLKDAINFARHFLFETLGPDADTLAARIESARNGADLTAALEKGRDAIAAIAGRRKAELYWEGIADRTGKPVQVTAAAGRSEPAGG